MSRQVKPTRAELRDTKRRLAMVKRGHKLLQRKQESLMVELFRALELYREQERATAAAYAAAERAAAVAEMAAGRHASWGFAMTRAGLKGVEVASAVYMGVRLSEYRLADAGGGARFVPGEQPQGAAAALKSEELLRHCVARAEAEARIMALLDEIERTKRRVNALELKVIPRLEADAAFILSRLEELERESLFALKRIRAKLGAGNR